MLTQSIEKRFLIHLLMTNDTIYRGLLTLVYLLYYHYKYINLFMYLFLICSLYLLLPYSLF